MARIDNAIVVSMIKAVIKMLSGDLAKDWGTRIVCARSVLDELVEHLQSAPKSPVGGSVSDDLDDDAAEAQAEILGG